jgi:uncharacterized protein YjbI with pentapeptide repeats
MPATTVLLRDQTVAGEDFSRQKLDRFMAVNCVFTRCDFSGVAAKEFVFGGGKQPSSYVDCVFDGARLTGTGADIASLRSCSFRGVRISKWECRTVDLIDCTFTGTLRDCVFDGVPLKRLAEQRGKAENTLTGNDFSGCELIGVDFNAGVDLDRQKLPTGPAYLWIAELGPAVTALSAAAADWGTADPSGARAVVSFLGKAADKGQASFFARVADYQKILGPAFDGAVAFLRSSGLDRAVGSAGR